MGPNKFITIKGRVLLDLTEDTVTPETLGKGVTAHDRSGEPIVGRMEGGGGGGECSGKHIIEVDELPEVGEGDAVYGVKGLTDLIIVEQGEAMSFADTLGAVSGIIATSETFATIEPVEGMICYVTDMPEIYWCMGGTWMPLSDIMGGGECLGEIGGIGEADATTNGYYAVVGIGVLYQYIKGQFKRLFIKGSLEFKSNGDGTCKVSGIEYDYDINLVIPTVSPDGDTVTSIEISAFNRESNPYVFASVTIPNTVTEIKEQAFRYAVFKQIELVDGLTTLGSYAFAYNPALGSIIFPDGITSLPLSVCENCTSLTNVTIGKSVTKIGGWAFSGCTALSTITFTGTIEQWNAITKDSFWLSKAPVKQVTCSDGTVTL